METVNIGIDELKEIISDTVKKAIVEERENLYNLMMPEVDAAEMNDIIKIHGEMPSNEEYVDASEWLNNES
jgi:hypothetical protein